MAVAVDFRLGIERNLDIEYMNYRERLVSVISEETGVSVRQKSGFTGQK